MSNNGNGHTPPNPPAVPNIATLLDTDDPAEQAARIQYLLGQAAPRYTLIIQSGPEGVAVQPVGQPMSLELIYALLEQAELVTRQEERRQLEAQLAAVQAAAQPGSAPQ